MVKVLAAMAEELTMILSVEGMMFRTVTVKNRYSGFITRTRTHTIEKPSLDSGVVRSIARKLLFELNEGRPIRLIGLKVSGLQAGDRRSRRIDEFRD